MAIEVFISYSHQDQALRTELEKHLSNLKRQNIITSWYDGNIIPGKELEPEIMQHLKHAQIILLLVSADFIASDFCYSIEMKEAIARHNANQARVIPILLRPTDWKGAPFAILKMLPTDAKAVTRWPTLDDAFEDVVQGIRAAIDELISKGQSSKPQPTKRNIPFERNNLFTGREEVLEHLHTALSVGKTTALTQAISGLGGIGKTQTAIEYAYRYQDDYEFIYWIKAESRESIISDFVTMSYLLNLPEQHEQDQSRVVAAVKRWFQDNTSWLLARQQGRLSMLWKVYRWRLTRQAPLSMKRNAAWQTTCVSSKHARSNSCNGEEGWRQTIQTRLQQPFLFPLRKYKKQILPLPTSSACVLF
jgi:hypothetical protein